MIRGRGFTGSTESSSASGVEVKAAKLIARAVVEEAWRSGCKRYDASLPRFVSASVRSSLGLDRCPPALRMVQVRSCAGPCSGQRPASAPILSRLTSLSHRPPLAAAGRCTAFQSSGLLGCLHPALNLGRVHWLSQPQHNLLVADHMQRAYAYIPGLGCRALNLPDVKS